jgi:hypothetical protein
LRYRSTAPSLRPLGLTGSDVSPFCLTAEPPEMGLSSMFSSKADTQVYQTGAHSRTQNSRAYLLALIAYMGIFLFGCAPSSS